MDSNEFRKQFSRAAEYYNSGRFPAAAELVEKLLKEYPDHPDLLFTYARALVQLGRFVEADRVCVEIITKFNDSRAVELRGRIPEQHRSNDATVPAPPAPPRTGSRRRWTLVATFAIAGMMLYCYLAIFPRLVRVLPFADATRIGTIQFRAEDGSWQTLADAEGKVYVWRSRELKLTLDPDVLADGAGIKALDALLAFEPDTFTEIEATNAPIGDDGLRRFASFSSLRVLTLRNAGISGPGLVHLSADTPLHTLDFADNPITDDWVPWIAQIVTLQSLDLSGVDISDEGMASLAPLTNLVELSPPSHISDEGVKAIVSLKSLRRLDLRARPITDRAAKFLALLTDLDYLDLSGTAVTDEGLTRLAGLTKLRTLGLADTYLTRRASNSLGTLGNLEELDLGGTRIGNEGVVGLATLSALRRLNLQRCFAESPLSSEAAEVLGSLPALAEVNLSHNTLLPEAWASLSASVSLRRLILTNVPLPESALANLRAESPNREVIHSVPVHETFRFPSDRSFGRLYLKNVDPNGNGDTWRFWVELKGTIALPAAETLRIELTPLGVENIDVLAQLFGPAAEQIEVDAFPVVECDYSAFGNFPVLRQVDLRDVPPAPFATVMARSPVSSLALLGPRWTPEQMQTLPEMPAIRSLKLDSVSFNSIDGATLSGFPAIEELALSNFAILSANLDAPESAEITVIDLRGADIAPEIAAIIAEQLPRAEILTESKVSRLISFPETESAGILWHRAPGERDRAWTRIGEAQGRVEVPEGHILRLDASREASRASVLAGLPADAIHTLNLTGPAISDETVRGLQRWTALRELDLSGANVTDATIALLSDSSPGSAIDPTQFSYSRGSFMSLSRLNLSATKVQGRVLHRLRGFPELTHLDLSQSLADPSIADALRPLTQLEVLAVEGAPIGRLGVAGLARRLPDATILTDEAAPEVPQPQRNARTLVARENSVGEVLVRDGRTRKSAQWVSIGPLNGTRTFPADTQTRLVLGPRDLDDVSALDAAPLEQFDEIVITAGSRITTGAMQALAHATGLANFDASGAVFEPGAFSLVGELVHLSSLVLANARFDHDELWVLRKLRALEHIDLSGTGAGAEAMQHLQALPRLARLALNNESGFGDQDASVAARMPSLQHVELNKTSLGDTGASALLKLPALKFLDLFGTPAASEAPIPTDKAVISRKRRLSASEIESLTPKIQNLVRANPGGERARQLAAAVDTENLNEIDPDSLKQIQAIAIAAVRDSDAPIDAALLTDLSGAETLRAAPEPVRASLQEAALKAIAARKGRIDTQDLSEVSGVQDIQRLDEAERSTLHKSALAALANTTERIQTEDLLLVDDVERLQDIPAARRAGLQRAALGALSDSAPGITVDGLAQISGVERFAAIPRDDLDELQTMAIGALIESEDGFTAKEVAAIEGYAAFNEIPETELRDIQELGMSAMAHSDTGIVHPGIAALGGEDHYDDLVEPSMQGLQQLAVDTLVDSELLITSETFAQIAGRDEFNEVPEERKTEVQGVALTAMADSSTGITVDGLAELGGVDSFNEFESTELVELQDIALLAMADSSTGITVDGLAVLTGTDSLAFAPREQVDDIRLRAVSAMGKSSTGIEASRLAEILGDTALTELRLARTPVGDTDLLNIPDFTKLVVVDLAGCSSITDRSMERIAFAKDLNHLNVSGTQITSKGLFTLTELKDLEWLDISNTSINDRALSSLTFFPRLQTFLASNTAIEGVGLQYLNAPSLNRLDVSYTFVTDAALAGIPPLPSLQHLAIRRTRLSDASAPAIRQYAGLRELDIAECPGFSDEGLGALESLKNLSTLTLHDTAVSERSLPKLAHFSGLSYLTVNQAHFSLSAIDELRRSLPKCTVSGVGTLKSDLLELEQLAGKDAGVQPFIDLAFERARRTINFVYGILLMLVVSIILAGPFVPAYITALERIQRSSRPGQFADSARFGARLLYIVVTRGGPALLYASRWILLVAAIGVGLYYVMGVLVDFWDTYLDNSNNRY